MVGFNILINTAKGKEAIVSYMIEERLKALTERNFMERKIYENFTERKLFLDEITEKYIYSWRLRERGALLDRFINSHSLIIELKKVMKDIIALSDSFLQSQGAQKDIDYIIEEVK